MTNGQEVLLEIMGETSKFQLCGRLLKLGTAGTVRYFWMDHRKFRRGKGGDNYKACVDYWWACMRSIGADNEEATQENLVLAEMYSIFMGAKGLQRIFVDAHLCKSAGRQCDVDDLGRVCWTRMTGLDEEECRRLQLLAQTRDVEAVRHELAGLFLGEPMAKEDRSASEEALRAWLRIGEQSLRTGGRAGLRAFVDSEVKPWMKRLRRRGDLDREHRFLNRLGYEAKAAFYLTYANAWGGLIPWLVAHGGLDPIGARLMRLMHNQNQPVDDPTSTPAVRRDVFCGQVLALHPLTAILQEEPQHLQALGAWFGHPAYEALQDAGQAGESPEYWGIVAAILIAAHEYAATRSRWDETRDKKIIRPDDWSEIPARDE